MTNINSGKIWKKKCPMLEESLYKRQKKHFFYLKTIVFAVEINFLSVFWIYVFIHF